MRHTYTLAVLLAIIVIVVACSKINLTEANEAQHIHQSLVDKGIQKFSLTDVKESLVSRSDTPCIWDFDLDGKITVEDLSVVLQEYGGLYTVDDIGSFLTAYGSSYTLDVILLWNNWIQDVNCSLDWNTYHKLRCAGNVVPLELDIVEVEWIHEGVVVGTDPEKMDWVTYGETGKCNNVDSYQPNCNGLQEITCRLFINNAVYERTNIGMALINIPESLNIETCLGVGPYELMSYDFNTYINLEFLTQ